MSENGNGSSKWQLGFWIISVGLVLIGGNVISNDRVRASEDIRIKDDLEARFEKFQMQNNEAHIAIIGDLREIKALISKNVHGT